MVDVWLEKMQKNDLFYVPRWDLDLKIGGNIFGGMFLDAYSMFDSVRIVIF